jgi:hypothetical protein
MPTLTDDQFLGEVDALINGRTNSLVEKKPEEAAPVVPPVETPPVEVPAQEPAQTPAENPPVTPEVVVPPVETPPGEPAKEPALGADGKPVEAPIPPSEPDYKAIHARLFGTPIRAGGQDITIQNVDEAVSLIQKGVGFHNKMNRLQGDLKYVEMLRNNNLLDESKLSLLIDAQQGKPGAIKKLLDAAKVDPLTLDSPEASSYAPSDHRVTDEQVQFNSAVADLTESTHGLAVLQDAKGWDQASKAEIYKAPQVLGFLANQKESGRYDLIKAQVNREKMLGNIPATESFLTAYTRVGQQMMQAGAFGQPTVTPTPTPVAQKIVTPPAPANVKQAAAAAPTKTSGGPSAKVAVDTASMGDADFENFFKKTFKI